MFFNSPQFANLGQLLQMMMQNRMRTPPMGSPSTIKPFTVNNQSAGAYQPPAPVPPAAPDPSKPKLGPNGRVIGDH